MQEYVKFELEDEMKQIILITSTEDLYFLQDDIYDDFSIKFGKQFTILVDLFLRNGYSFNRFVSLDFNGKKQCKSLIKNPREVSEEAKSKIKDYLKLHLDELENSALSKKTINYVLMDK